MKVAREHLVIYLCRDLVLQVKKKLLQLHFYWGLLCGSNLTMQEKNCNKFYRLAFPLNEAPYDSYYQWQLIEFTLFDKPLIHMKLENNYWL